EPGRAQPGLRRPARMQTLGPGTLREIFDDAAGHGADDAERVDKLARIELERGADGGRRRHGAEHGGGMKAGLVHPLASTDAQPPPTPAGARDRGRARGPGGRRARGAWRPRRHDDGAGMDWTAFEGIVEILAMRGGAVDEGGARRAHAARLADRAARPLLVPA